MKGAPGGMTSVGAYHSDTRSERWNGVETAFVWQKGGVG